MEKQFVLMTRSYKYGGYCVAGFDAETGRWMRLVASEDPAKSEIPKAVFEGFDFLDILKVEVRSLPPCLCQTENFLLDMKIPPVRIGNFPFARLLDKLFLSGENLLFGNARAYLSEREIADMPYSLALVKADRVHLGYYRDEEGKKRFPCKFFYRGTEYSDITVTDPVYRVDALAGEDFPHALIVVSLPAVPYKNGKYYKFAARILPISEKLSEHIDAHLPEGEEEAEEEGREGKTVEEVRAFLQALAEGKDLLTGESIEVPEEYKTMFRLAAERVREIAFFGRAGERPVYRHWSPEEEAKLVREYRSKISIERIAKMHGRSVGGIRSRLAKLGFPEE